MLNVPSKTLYRWRDADAWDKDRDALATTGITALKDSMILATRQLKDMLDDPAQFTGANVDKLLKLINLIGRMDKDIDRRGNVLLGLGEFIEFMQAHHPEELGRLQPFFIEFQTHITKKYA